MSSQKPVRRKRKLESFKSRYNMSPSEWRELKRTDAIKALQLRLIAYKKTLSTKKTTY